MSTTTPPNTSISETVLPPPPTLRDHIAITPDTCGGKPRIAGHRIKVSDIVICHEHNGMSPKQIVEAFPTINMAEVYAALSYYWDHRSEIDEEIKADEEYFEKMSKSAKSKFSAV
jgi:uncharacterized protein (DUF433 family)